LLQKDAILKLIEIAPILDKVSFKEVLELTSPYKICPINLSEEEDKELVETLTQACKHFLALCNKTKRRYEGDRINEVSKAIENELVEEIRKTGFSTKILSAQGYPDIELVDKHNRPSYLEIKITSKTKKPALELSIIVRKRKLQVTRDICCSAWGLQKPARNSGKLKSGL